MTNLPITGTPSPSPGGAASTAQASTRPAEEPLRSGSANSSQPSGEGGSPASAPLLADTAEPFAAHLARQIGEGGSPSTSVAPGAITMDSATLPLKNEQDPASVAASAPSDQAGMLAAILLQLPQEMRTPVASHAAGASTATKKAGMDIDVSARKPASRPDAKLGKASAAPGDAAAIPADLPSLADVAGRDAVKRMEAAATLTPPNPNTTPLVASPVISAVMPSRLADPAQTISTPMGSSGWADDFSQKITWMGTQKNQVAELHLNPPDLGPLNVVLKISDDQATALFTSPHSAVREAVENAMPKLREALADNGIMLGNATVSDQFPRDRGAEGFLNQDAGPAAQRWGASGTLEPAVPSPATAQVVPARRHNGMVDTFA